jgi:deazaflavin-dependent oxidoreductase (nitroreductase family)
MNDTPTTTPTTNDWNSEIIEHFRANQGTMHSGPFKGGQLLLLTTSGARSGRLHTNPLAYTRDGDRYVVIASKGGAPTNPDWYHNVVANPAVTIEVGPERFPATARVAEGEERDRLYAAQAAVMPGFAEYQRHTRRRIPVITLERSAAQAQ